MDMPIEDVSHNVSFFKECQEYLVQLQQTQAVTPATQRRELQVRTNFNSPVNRLRYNDLYDDEVILLAEHFKGSEFDFEANAVERFEIQFPETSMNENLRATLLNWDNTPRCSAPSPKRWVNALCPRCLTYESLYSELWRSGHFPFPQTKCMVVNTDSMGDGIHWFMVFVETEASVPTSAGARPPVHVTSSASQIAQHRPQTGAKTGRSPNHNHLEEVAVPRAKHTKARKELFK